MALQCRIVEKTSGGIDYVNAPNGNRSLLFDNLVGRVNGDTQLATDIYALTETEEYNNITEGEKADYRANIFTKLSESNPNKTHTLVHFGKKIPFKIKDIKYQTKDINNYRTTTAVLVDGKRALTLGRVRTTYNGNNVQIESTLLNTLEVEENGKKKAITGLGIGTAMYKAAIKKALFDGYGFQSDISQTQEAKGVWKKLEETGVVEYKNGRYIIEPYPSGYDVNGEASADVLLRYSKQNEDVLTSQERVDTINTAMALGVNNIQELQEVLEKAFLKDGVIMFDRNKMKLAGYTEYEANSILNNTDLQEKIKNTIYSLENSQDIVIPEYDQAFIVSTGGVDSLGKQNIRNPFVVKSEITDAVAGSLSEKDVVEKLPETYRSDYYNNAVFRQAVNLIGLSTQNLQVKNIKDGVLRDSIEDSTIDLLENTLDIAENPPLEDNITYLTSISPSVWNTSTEEIKTLLKEVSNQSINNAIDIVGIENHIYTKSQGQITDLLKSLQNMLDDPSPITITDFSNYRDVFFNKPLIYQKQATKTNDSTDVLLETDLSQYEVFSKYRLLQKSQGIYKNIEETPLEELYTMFFANIQAGNVSVGEEVTSIQEVKDLVQESISEIQVESQNVDTDILEEMWMYKKYFGLPMNIITTPLEEVSDERHANFEGNYDYLTEQFISDFQKQKLATKDAWYDNFKITDKGIELKNKDSITKYYVLENVPSNIKDDFLQYNLISKSLNLPIKELNIETTQTNLLQLNREAAIANPRTVAKLKGQYKKLSEKTIAVTNNFTTFVRTNEGVYELDRSIGNVNFYNKLPTPSNSNYYQFKQHPLKPTTDIDYSSYNYLETQPDQYVQETNYTTEKELETINQNHFDCA